MKKLLLILLAVTALACGDQSKRSDNNEAGTGTEQNADQNNEETVSPDTTDTKQQSDTTTYDGKPDSRQ
jgi:hypothetical protein